MVTFTDRAAHVKDHRTKWSHFMIRAILKMNTKRHGRQVRTSGTIFTCNTLIPIESKEQNIRAAFARRAFISIENRVTITE